MLGQSHLIEHAVEVIHVLCLQHLQAGERIVSIEVQDFFLAFDLDECIALIGEERYIAVGQAIEIVSESGWILGQEAVAGLQEQLKGFVLIASANSNPCIS